MFTPKAKRIKLELEGPVFTTPIRFDENGAEISSPASSSNHQDHQTPCSSVGADDSPCGSAEYSHLKQQLHERNIQRENLLIKIEDLAEKNKKYKDHLDTQEGSRHSQVQVLQRTHSTHLSDRDHLIDSLKDLISDHENTIQQLETRLQGAGPSSGTSATAQKPGASTISASSVSLPPTAARAEVTSRLVADIQRLQDEKVDLTSQLLEAQGQLEAYNKKISALEKALTARQKADREHDKENIAQGEDGGSPGSCSTDTEKQLEKVQAENRQLAAEVSSLHRFYTRNPSVSYSTQAEQIRRLEEEKEELGSRVSSCQGALQQREAQWRDLEADLRVEMAAAQSQKLHAERQLTQLQNRLSSLMERRVSWQEKESTLREEISGAHTEKRQTAQQLRDLQAKWTALQARDPDVVTKIVQVEVESEEIKGQVEALTDSVRDWEHRCTERDRIVADLHKQARVLSDKLEKGDEERKLIQECLEEEVERERESKALAVSDVRREMEGRLYDLQLANQHVRLSAARLQSGAEGLRQAYTLLATQARQFPNMVSLALKEAGEKMTRVVSGVSEENKELVRKYHKEMKLRKKYHNELVELKGNIRVLCRVRPAIKEDGTGPDSEKVVTYDPDDDGLIYVSHKGRIQTFEFDKVFADSSSQMQVFDEVRSLVTCCIDGFNICIFAYGQTGSGKTYTMEGPDSDPGINQRALQELFSETAERGEDWSFTIQVSVMEIYNETIRDLLSSDYMNKLDVKMKAEGGGFHVPGLVTVTVQSLQDINQVFSEGKKNRATATTNLNEHSSRSHCLLCVTVSGFNRVTNTQSFGRLNLVDLAGSERVSKSGADGARLKEAQSINKSLASLGDVIHALRVKQTHIPFRNSKLTYLLRDSLSGDSKTLMIVQVAPVEKNVSETTCSLSFGQRVRTVELGIASRKIETADVEKTPSSPTGYGTSSPAVKKVQSSPSFSSPTSTQTRSTPSKHPSSAPRITRQTSRK